MIEITQEMIDSAPDLVKNGFDPLLHDWSNPKPYDTFEYVNGSQIFDELGNPVLDDLDNPTYEQVLQQVTKYRLTGYAAKQPSPVVYPVFNVLTPTVTVGGNPVTPVNGFYYVQHGLPIEITTTATLENGESITLPPPLAMPVVMFDANQQPAIKRYATTSVTSGVVTANITIDESGAWKVREDFVNESLAEVGQPWRVAMDTITFLVM